MKPPFLSRLVPRPIAVLGLVGYGLFSPAVPLDLLGVLDMNQGTGMLVLVPGFLFEFIALPIWLIAKGFTTPSRHRPWLADDPARRSPGPAIASGGRRTLLFAGRQGGMGSVQDMTSAVTTAPAGMTV